MGEMSMDQIDRQLADLEQRKARIIEEELTKAQEAERQRAEAEARAMRALIRDFNAAAADLREKQLALFHKAAELTLEVLYADALHWTLAVYPKGPTQYPEKQLAKALEVYVPDHRVVKVGGFPV